MVTPICLFPISLSKQRVLAAVSIKHLPLVSAGLYSIKRGISGR